MKNVPTSSFLLGQLWKNNRLKALILAAGRDILSQTEPSETVPVYVRLANEMEAHRGSRNIA